MWLQTTQLGNKPTQTGLALNSKPQLTWALAIVQRPNHASPGPSLYYSPRRGTLFFCTLHKPRTPLLLPLLSSDGVGLLPFSMTQTTEIKIPHSTPTTSLRCPRHSTFSRYPAQVCPCSYLQPTRHFCTFSRFLEFTEENSSSQV